MESGRGGLVREVEASLVFFTTLMDKTALAELSFLVIRFFSEETARGGWEFFTTEAKEATFLMFEWLEPSDPTLKARLVTGGGGMKLEAIADGLSWEFLALSMVDGG